MGINNFISNFPKGNYGVILELILYGFVSMIASTLLLYLSISIGHLFNKSRILAKPHRLIWGFFIFKVKKGGI